MRRTAVFALASAISMIAAAGDDRVEVCYAVADGASPGLDQGAGPDRLLRLRPNGTGLSLVGRTGSSWMEAISLNRAQNVLYAASRDTLGTIDTSTGEFLPIGRARTCESPNGTVFLNDFDALAWDIDNTTLWAVERDGVPSDVRTQTGEFLMQLDPSTGAPVGGTCIELTSSAPEITARTDVDALTFTPDGRALASVNSGSGRGNQLVEIDVSTGNVTPIAGTDVDDIEGLHFTESGVLLGTTGLSTNAPNSLLAINPATGVTAFIGDPGLLEVPLADGTVTSDIEGISCRLEPPTVIENPSIDVEKATNGVDADAPSGPALAVGDTVTWTYVVTNDGDVDLQDIVVTDNIEGEICVIPALAPGASDTCTATGIAVEGQYANEATASGTTEAGQLVEDSDPSHYIASIVDPGNPAIDIEKATNDQDADLPPGPELSVGDGVTWTYVVTNTGDVDLVNVNVTDNREGAICTIASLIVGASDTCTASSTAVEGQYANIASAIGSTSDGRDVTDTDPSHYVATVIVDPGNPAIDIEKATNGVDADVAPGPALNVGDAVTWTYVVTNTGDLLLVDLVVTDDLEGAICEIAQLAPGASAECSADGLAAEGQYSNVGSVTGDTEGGVTVTDSDPSNYTASVVVNPGDPAIDIEKATNGLDADMMPGPSLNVGDAVTWTYVVSNTGDVVLVDVVVTDDLEGEVCTIERLDPGASAECIASSTATEGQYSNVGSVTGDTEGGVTVTDSDPSNYIASVVVNPGDPAIDIEKATNGVDADAAPGPQLEPDDSVTWTYVVTNTGDVALLNVTVTDDLEGAVCEFARLEIGASETCELGGTATLGQYRNVATAIGTGESGGEVSDADPSHYNAAVIVGPGTPAIDLEKFTNGIDADEGPGPRLEIGARVQWTYIVTNTGNLDLTDVTIVDDVEGAVCVIAELPIGTQRQCNLSAFAIAGEYENNGSVTARATNGQTVTDTDPSHYIAAILSSGDPAIDIEKFTNGADADVPPGPLLEVGDDVVWTYVVRNTGQAVLVNIQVTDDLEGGVCVIPRLAPGEAFTCRLEGIVQLAPYANVGTAQGRDGRGTIVTDSDPSHYTTDVSISGPLPPGGGPISAPVNARWALISLMLLMMVVGQRALRRN